MTSHVLVPAWVAEYHYLNHLYKMDPNYVRPSSFLQPNGMFKVYVNIKIIIDV